MSNNRDESRLSHEQDREDDPEDGHAGGTQTRRRAYEQTSSRAEEPFGFTLAICSTVT
jgi:hypothetical protein